jgi:voltage-gated potassium channel
MSDTSLDDHRRLAWERHAEWPLTVLAVLFLAAYAAPILNPDLPRIVRQSCDIAGWTIWLLFAVDYLVRLTVTNKRSRFVRRNILDLATVILPVLRPLRILRVVRALRVLDRRATDGLRGKIAIYFPTAVALVVSVAALAVLDAERHSPNSNISSFGDAAWWAITTITTVGYGDRFPVTGEGRIVAVGLMLAGISLLGVVTAAVASWFVERVNEVQQAALATRSDVDLILAEVRALRAELREIREQPPRP